MILTHILILSVLFLLIINIFLAIKARKNDVDGRLIELKNLIDTLRIGVIETKRELKDEFASNRKENSDLAIGFRKEVTDNLSQFVQTFSNQLGNLTNLNEQKLEVIRKTFDERISHFQKWIGEDTKEARQELHQNLESFNKELNDALRDYKDRLREQFSDFERSQKTQNVANSERISELKLSLEKSVRTMQEGNESKLEEMRKTVDEKLNETLEKRLGESFKQVSDRLEAVHKGLGEMQTLATSVGDLRKVMSNVKSRGILGEYQLQNIIEDLLTSDQYQKNVRTKPTSNAIVEFAVKMPNASDNAKPLWLPIDSKFPKEDYEALVDAYEKGDVGKIDEHKKSFVNAIKKSAREIKERYIDPPNTTEYGIMFLPYESLFGEVLRCHGLFELLQRDYRITVTGPTTLSALLNSLQMGFRTLAIEKRSSEVWRLLATVKTEFNQFGDILAKTKKKLIEATDVLDSHEIKTRAIERRLRDVEESPTTMNHSVLNIDEVKSQDFLD